MKRFRLHWVGTIAAVIGLVGGGLAQAQTCNLNPPLTHCAGGPPNLGCQGPCGGTVSVSSATSDVCNAGHSFNLIGTAYQDTCAGGIVGSCPIQCPAATALPPLRFWAYDNYKGANSGCASSCAATWLVNAKIDFGVGPANGHWILYQADYSNPAIDGCVLAAGSPPTVAEISDVTGTGTPGHGAWYVINSAPIGGGLYDFDQVTDAAGGCGRKDFPIHPVSAVTIAGRTQSCTDSTTTTMGAGNSNAAYFDVQVNITDPMPVWNTQNGVNGDATATAGSGLIKGYQIVYFKGAEPTTSDYRVGGWQPVLDQTNPTLAHAVVPIPVSNPVTVTLPLGLATDNYWFAARLVYADASLNELGTFDPAVANAGPDVTSPLGGHCGPVIFFLDAVEFANLRATRDGTSVKVSWDTLMEDDVAGFRVFRSLSPNGADAEAADGGQATLAHGYPSSYGRIDPAAPRVATYYYVQEITSSGPGMRSDLIPVPALVPTAPVASPSSGGRARGRHR